MWHYKNVDMGEPPYYETSEWPAIPQVFTLLGTGDESNNRAVKEVEWAVNFYDLQQIKFYVGQTVIMVE
jgi:hypothetical protein